MGFKLDIGQADTGFMKLIILLWTIALYCLGCENNQFSQDSIKESSAYVDALNKIRRDKQDRLNECSKIKNGCNTRCGYGSHADHVCRENCNEDYFVCEQRVHEEFMLESDRQGLTKYVLK